MYEPLGLSLQPRRPISRAPSEQGEPGNLQWGKIIPHMHLYSLIFLGMGEKKGKGKATGGKRLLNIHLKIHALPLSYCP